MIFQCAGKFSVRSFVNNVPEAARDHQEKNKVFLDKETADTFCKILNDTKGVKAFLNRLTKP